MSKQISEIKRDQQDHQINEDEISIGNLIAIGSFGFVYQSPDKQNEVIKVIPIYGYDYNSETERQQETNLENEYFIHNSISEMKFDIHLFDQRSNSMKLHKNQQMVANITSNLTRFKIGEDFKSRLQRDLKSSGKAVRNLKDIGYFYSIEKVSDFYRNIARHNREPFILISIFQLIEFYQQLLTVDINYAHHDLHAANLAYVVEGGYFSAKVIDFGFACFNDETINIISKAGHDSDVPSLSKQQHARLDIASLIGSIYLITGNSFYFDLICNPSCLYSCSKKFGPTSNFHDFYSLNKSYQYHAVKGCDVHNQLDLQDLKHRISGELTTKYGVQWYSHIENPYEYGAFMSKLGHF